MAITDAYAAAAQYRSITGKTDTAQDAEILVDLKSISRYLDGKLGRFFNKDVSAVDRVYVPAENSIYIWTDDIVSVTSVKFDTSGDDTYLTTLESTDWELLPLNSNRGPEPRPYTKLAMTPWGNYGRFSKNVRVKINGIYGWPAVPDSIQRATIHLTAILRLESPRATRRIAELGDIMEASPDAMNIIRQLTDRYRKVSYI